MGSGVFRRGKPRFIGTLRKVPTRRWGLSADEVKDGLARKHRICTETSRLRKQGTGMFKTPFDLKWVALCVAALTAMAASANELPTLTPQNSLAIDQSGPDAVRPVVSCLAFSSDGKYLVTAGDDHVVRVWQAADSRGFGGTTNGRDFVLGEQWENHADWVRAAAFRPDGGVLATGGDDQRVRLWDLPGARAPVVLPGVIEGIRALDFSPEGRYLAVAGFDDRVRVFHSESGRAERELVAPGGDLRSVVFSPDGSQVAAAGRTGVVRVWRVADGTPVHDFAAGSRRIRAVQYSEDGTLLAAGGDDGEIRLWNTTTGRLEGRLPALPGRVMALCFYGPGRLAVGRSNNSMELWDLAARQPIAKLEGHTGSVAALAYEPQSGTLVSGGFDCTVQFWNVQP